MKILTRIFLIAIALAMTSCHAYVTGPALWHHNSSAAFDVFVGLWFIDIAFFVYACVVPVESKGKV